MQKTISYFQIDVYGGKCKNYIQTQNEIESKKWFFIKKVKKSSP
jgi:hypothetical protein